MEEIKIFIKIAMMLVFAPFILVAALYCRIKSKNKNDRYYNTYRLYMDCYSFILPVVCFMAMPLTAFIYLINI